MTDAATPVVPQSGNLKEVSAVRVYFLAAAGNHTGLATFRLQDRNVEVHFKKGNPEYVGSSHPEDSVDVFLEKQGLVAGVQLAQARTAKAQFGDDLVAALFALGILNPTTAFGQLSQRAQGLLSRVISAEEGTFSFEPKELPAFKAMPLGNKWAVLVERVRRMAAPELKRRLWPWLDLPIMKSTGPVPVTELRLSPQEMRAMGSLDGVRSLNQLTQAAPQEADHFLRLAFLLRDMEIVSFWGEPAKGKAPPPEPVSAAAPTTGKHARPQPTAAPPKAQAPKVAPKPPPAAAKPAPVAPPAPPPKVDPQKELAQLRARAEAVQKQTLFEVLELKENADEAQVKAAYLKLAKLYHPDTVREGAAPEVAKLKSEIFTRIGEAHRRLSDPKGRADYLEELKAGAGEAMDVQSIIKAEADFQKGCLLVKGKNFPEALKVFEEAIRLNPEEGEFYAWRGYARFFTLQDKKVGLSQAQQDTKKALEKNPKCAQAHYLLGQLYRLSEREREAVDSYEKTLALQPNHVDAERELRLLRTRLSKKK